MTDRTTINVSKEAHRKAKEAKQEDESWSDYITRCIDNQESPNPCVDNEALYEARDEIISAITAECGDVATTEDLRDLVNRLDDLENTIPRKTVEELR